MLIGDVMPGRQTSGRRLPMLRFRTLGSRWVDPLVLVSLMGPPCGSLGQTANVKCDRGHDFEAQLSKTADILLL